MVFSGSLRAGVRLVSAAALAGVLAHGSGANAASLFVVTDTDNADNDFIAACGGGDNFGCEYAVAQGVAGSRDDSGDTEVTIFNRLNNSVVSGNTNADTILDFVDPSNFEVRYVAPTGGGGATGTLFLTAMGADEIMDDYDFSLPVGGDPNGNPTSPASSVVLRIARAAATNLQLNGMALPDLDVLDPASVGYLYIGGFDVTADWTLTGTIDLNPSFDGSGTGFQVKVTDLNVVPLPPSLAFMLGGLCGLVLLRRRRTVG